MKRVLIITYSVNINLQHKSVNWTSAKSTLSLYTKHFLTRNKSNARKIWEAINDLTNRKTKTLAPNKLQKENGDIITDSEEIAEEFNKFFVNIGSSMTKSIPLVNRSLTQRTNHVDLANSIFRTLYTL